MSRARARRYASLLVLGMLVLGLVWVPDSHAGQCSTFTTYADGQTVNASSLNSSLTQGAVTNSTPTCVDGASASVTAMQVTTDPGGVGSESLATTLLGELQRIRFVLKKMTGWAQWYSYTNNLKPPTTIETTLQAAIQLDPYGTSAGNTGELRFLELAANGTNYVGFKAANSLAGDVIWTLPVADGTASQVLSTDGAKALSWATAITGTLASGQIVFGTGTGSVSVDSGLTWDNTNKILGWARTFSGTLSSDKNAATGTAIHTGTAANAALYAANLSASLQSTGSYSGSPVSAAAALLFAELNNGSNSATTTTGVAGFVANSSATLNAGGTIANLYGGYLKANVKVSGTVTNAYGLYLESQTVGGTLNIGVAVKGSNPLQLIDIPSASGTRYLCIGTTGLVTSSASACSGT